MQSQNTPTKPKEKILVGNPLLKTAIKSLDDAFKKDIKDEWLDDWINAVKEVWVSILDQTEEDEKRAIQKDFLDELIIIIEFANKKSGLNKSVLTKLNNLKDELSSTDMVIGSTTTNHLNSSWIKQPRVWFGGSIQKNTLSLSPPNPSKEASNQPEAPKILKLPEP